VRQADSQRLQQCAAVADRCQTRSVHVKSTFGVRSGGRSLNGVGRGRLGRHDAAAAVNTAGGNASLVQDKCRQEECGEHHEVGGDTDGSEDAEPVQDLTQPGVRARLVPETDSKLFMTSHSVANDINALRLMR